MYKRQRHDGESNVDEEVPGLRGKRRESIWQELRLGRLHDEARGGIETAPQQPACGCVAEAAHRARRMEANPAALELRTKKVRLQVAGAFPSATGLLGPTQLPQKDEPAVELLSDAAARDRTARSRAAQGSLGRFVHEGTSIPRSVAGPGPSWVKTRSSLPQAA